MGKTLRSLFRRKLVHANTMREELRKIGLVLTGGGAIAVLVQSNVYGLSAMIVGLVFYYFGLTEPTGESKNG